MSDEYGEYIGVDNLHYSTVTDSKDAYIAGINNYLAPVGQISHDPSVKENTRYYDNKAMYTTNTEGETKVTITISGVPIKLGAELLGKIYDAQNGVMIDTGKANNAPWVTLSGRMELGDGGYRYFQYLKGKFAAGKEEAETEGDDIKPKTIELTYNAMVTMYEWDTPEGKTGVKAVKGETTDPAFNKGDTWFNIVQTPETVKQTINELALSSSDPANNATNVALATAPKLTFNNAISDYSNVSLLDLTDSSIIEITLTLDNTSKILTITPIANLTANKTYGILVQAVKDIYNQNFDTQLIKFTTVTA